MAIWRKCHWAFCCEKTFSWGTVSLELLIEHDTVAKAAVYTDAMEWELSGQLKAALEGQKFSLATMISSVASSEIEPGIREDISRMLAEQEI